MKFPDCFRKALVDPGQNAYFFANKGKYAHKIYEEAFDELIARKLMTPYMKKSLAFKTDALKKLGLYNSWTPHPEDILYN